MPDCILHFGLPKTGSTAIQFALRAGLLDPRFHYARFQEPLTDGGNHGRALAVLFSARAADFFLNVRDGLHGPALEDLKRQMGGRFDEEISRLGTATWILHAESLMFLKRSELERLRDHLHARDVVVRPVGYVRSFRESWESLYVQSLKSGVGSPPLRATRHPRASRRLVSDLDALFGRERVDLWLYDRRSFPRGCVVADFCGRLGIPAPSIGHEAVNRALCLDAVRLLHAHGLFAGDDLRRRGDRESLVRVLGELRGPRFRIHPAVVAESMAACASDLDWLEDRVGASLREGMDDDSAPSIASEEELLHFSAESLDWLAKRAGLPASSLAGGNPEVVGTAVSRLVERTAPRGGAAGSMRGLRDRFLALSTRLGQRLRTRVARRKPANPGAGDGASPRR